MIFNKKSTSILGFLLVALVVVLISGCVQNRQSSTKTTNGQIQPTGEIKEFTMTAKRFSFDPDMIIVNKGDTVRLLITSTDVPHGFAINEFDVNIQLSPGETEVVEFVADKVGTFTFFCSIPCGFGHANMQGKLIVN